jgi:hypothetical protein
MSQMGQQRRFSLALAISGLPLRADAETRVEVGRTDKILAGGGRQKMNSPPRHERLPVSDRIS